MAPTGSREMFSLGEREKNSNNKMSSQSLIEFASLRHYSQQLPRPRGPFLEGPEKFSHRETVAKSQTL